MRFPLTFLKILNMEIARVNNYWSITMMKTISMYIAKCEMIWFSTHNSEIIHVLQHAVTSNSRERKMRAWSNAPLSSRPSIHTSRFVYVKELQIGEERIDRKRDGEGERGTEKEKKWPSRRRTRGRNLVEEKHMGEGEKRSREGTRPPEVSGGLRGWSEVTPPRIRL